MPFGPDDVFGDEEEDDAVLPTPTPPRALKFIPSTRDFERDANGCYVDVHPVDAAVSIAMMIARNKIASATETGHALASVDDPTAKSALRQVQTIVKAALSRQLAEGNITIGEIRKEVAENGGLLVALDYVNERLSPRAMKTATAPLG